MIYDGKPKEGKELDIQIKMVDFANCVSNADQLYNEIPSSVNYPPTKNGPDSGYLLGLRTLITNFKEIYDDFKNDISYVNLDEKFNPNTVPRSSISVPNVISNDAQQEKLDFEENSIRDTFSRFHVLIKSLSNTRRVNVQMGL